MEEEKLKLLSELGGNYPFFSNVTSFGDLHHLYYLYEKRLVDFRMSCSGERCEPETILDKAEHGQFDLEGGDFKVRLTDRGLDAINALADKLIKEEIHIEFPEDPRRILHCIINHASYGEIKGWVRSLFADIVLGR
jgi:hypothetical protein